ncbi:MAG: outer membrane protein assembly factor BamB, partial [Methylococcus sp.]
DADPLVRDETVYVSGFQGGVTAVNLRDGDIQWRQNSVWSSHGMAIGRRSLFISDANSDVWQLDLRTGGDLWKQDALHQRRLTMPALIRNRLVLGDFEGYLHALSADDGSLVGRLQLDDEPIRAAPVVHNDTLFVYTAGGVLAAIGID